ncbi:MAG: class I SAM-dependent methyltransferase [Candidatus Helarchaeota archaeon]
MRAGSVLRWNAVKTLLQSHFSKKSVILDVGGYDGAIIQLMRSNFSCDSFMIVLDYNPLGLYTAKINGLKTIRGFALKLPVKNESIDAILCLDLIEHIKEDNILIRELSRSLKVGGKLILTTPSDTGVTFPFLPKKYTAFINKTWGHIRLGYSLPSLAKLLKRHNFLIEIKDSYFNYFSRLAYWICFLTKDLIKLSKFLFFLIIKAESFLKFKAEEHIIIAQKIKP